MPDMLSQLRETARRIKRDGIMLWFACRHPRTPWWVKALAVFVVAYALSPIDLVPDFIPVLGYLDDVILLPGLIWLIVQIMPRDVRDECRVQAQDWMAQQQRKPISRWGIAFVLGVWALVAWGMWRWWAQA